MGSDTQDNQDGRVLSAPGSRELDQQAVPALTGFDPSRVKWLIEAAWSDDVIHACDAAKAIPGDVWGQGAEGHYAFLAGLAALLGAAGVRDMIADSRERAEGWRERHPELVMSMRCPDRIVEDLGLAALAIDARSDATGTGAAEGESATAESRDAQPQPKDSTNG